MPPSTSENAQSGVQRRQLARLTRRYQELVAELTKAGFILKGSLVQRYLSCRTPGCHCSADPPRLHGPDWQWSTKVAGKTITRRINQEDAHQYQQLIDNRKRLERTLEEMYAVSSQAAEILFGHKTRTG